MPCQVTCLFKKETRHAVSRMLALSPELVVIPEFTGWHECNLVIGCTDWTSLFTMYSGKVSVVLSLTKWSSGTQVN
jgi:hypothetical protein